MADQASIRGVRPADQNLPGVGVGHTAGHADSTSVVGNIAELGNDIATLVELQAKLAAADFKESGEKAVVPLTLMVTAAALALAGVPVALLGVADLLVLLFKLSAGTAKLLTAVVAFTAAGLIVFASLRSLKSSLEPLRRSHEELLRNLSWVRTVLVHSGRSVPRRRL